MEIEE
jgi:hypothetical protein